MEHHFNVEVAKEVGVNAAVIMNNIVFWIQKNISDGNCIHDGKFWTYSTAKAMSVIFPYLTEKQIRTAIEKLVDAGYVETGDYSENRYARPTYYAMTEKAADIYGISCCENGQNEVTNLSIRENNLETSIYSKDRNINILNNNICKEVAKRFVRPSIEELQAYIQEKDLSVDAQQFLDYYESTGWMIGKKKMKDWKAAARNWSRRSRKEEPQKRGVYDGVLDF